MFDNYFDNIYDAETDNDLTDDEQDVHLNNIVLFIDENEVPYYYRYFFEISNDAIPSDQFYLIFEDDLECDIQRLENENLLMWYIISTKQREQ